MILALEISKPFSVKKEVRVWSVVSHDNRPQKILKGPSSLEGVAKGAFLAGAGFSSPELSYSELSSSLESFLAFLVVAAAGSAFLLAAGFFSASSSLDSSSLDDSSAAAALAVEK